MAVEGDRFGSHVCVGAESRTVSKQVVLVSGIRK